MLPVSVIDDIKMYLSRTTLEDRPEIEVRMRNLDLKHGGVTSKEFRRVMETLKENKVYPIVEHTTNYGMGNVRKSVDNSKLTTSWIKKEEVFNYISRDYPMKIAINKEVVIREVDNFTPDIIRERYRNSYIMKDKNYRIDVTEVSTLISKTRERFTTFEVEVELIEPWKNSGVVNELNSIISDVYKLLKGTYDIYSEEDKKAVIKFINTTFGSSATYFNIGNIAQARNIKMKDMVYGGLIGHPDVTYTVTHKTDGLRKLIVVHNDGLWIFMGDEFNKISFDSLALIMKKDDIEELITYQGFIIDGELVPKVNRLKGASEAQYWFLAFDCLSTPRNDNNSHLYGNKNIQDESHTSRLEKAQILTSLLKNEIIEGSVKSFVAFDTPTMFFEKMKTMFASIASLNYKEDGFMFTPVETPYNTGMDRISLRERSLVKYPEIVKWKHKESLTIDLEIQWERDGEDLYLQMFAGPDQKGADKVLFEGSTIEPLNDRVDIDHTLLKNSKGGTIIEFKFDYERRLLVPLKIRDDKRNPNKNEIVLDVWEDIHDPIDVDTMTGSSMKLMRKYHNKIKRALFDYAKYKIGRDLIGDKQTSKMDVLPTLLDIGSGRGGDVSKWFGYSKIVAVEPNQENFRELRERIEKFGLGDRVFLVNTVGEDTNQITQAVKTFIGTRVDVVSSMLSLSYFWKDNDTLDKLFNTISMNISQNGKYIFLTIDGDIVEHIFDPKIGRSLPLKDLTFGDYFRMKYNSDNSLDVYMKGTILENYASKDTFTVKEWLVRMDDISKRFIEFGFKPTETFRADKEKFMSLPERALSGMYTYGVYEKTFEAKSLFSLQVGFKQIIKIFPIKLNNYETTTVPEIPVLDIVTYREPYDSKIIIPENIIKQKVQYYSPTFQEIETRRINKIFPSSKMDETKVQLPKFDKKKLEKIRKPEKKEKHLVPRPFGEILVSPSKQPPLKKKEETPLISIKTVTEVVPIDYLKVSYSPYSGDDVVVDVQDKTFKDKIVRIATIEDGSSLFHCILKASYSKYVSQSDYRARRRIVKEIRRDIAFILGDEDESDPGRIYYETVNNGEYVALSQEKLLYDKVTEIKIDFSLKGLQMLINSNEPVNHEIFPIISDIMGIDVVSCFITENGIVFDKAPGIDATHRDVVVVSKNDEHYELMGIYVREGEQDMVQCLFPFDHPFVERVMKSKQ